MTNQKHFVEKSQPISDSDLYKYDMGGVDDNATDPISTQNPVSTNPVESIRESSAPQNEPQIYAEQSSAPARQENYLKYADASSFNTNEYLSTTEIQVSRKYNQWHPENERSQSCRYGCLYLQY